MDHAGNTNILLEEMLQSAKGSLRHQGYINFLEVPADFDHFTFLQRLGTPMCQYDGQLVWSIKPELGFENVYHSLNNKPLTAHTECYEFEGVPPRYLALWCIKAPQGGGGETTLADGYEFMASLTEEERTALSMHVCQFHSTAGLRESKLERTALHPIYDLSMSPDKPIIRYSFACLDPMGNPFITEIQQRVLDFFTRTCFAISYQERSLLIWDNWRMLHARTGFGDQQRHLKRVWLSEHTL